MRETWTCVCGMQWSEWDSECSRCGCKKPGRGKKFPIDYDPELLPKTTRDFVKTNKEVGK